jgi:hypothetical protein
LLLAAVPSAVSVATAVDNAALTTLPFVPFG